MVTRRALKIGAPVLWLFLSAAMVATVGVPTSRLLVFAWVGSGVAAAAITELPRKLPRFIAEWSPFMGVLVLYDRLRGYADGALVHARSLPQIRLEAALFGKPIPTVWLQSHLWHGAHDLRWWDYAAWFVYLTYFIGTLIVAAVLWTWAHDHFARFATMVCVLALAGFATYVLYPADPPWLAARHGSIGEANRTMKIVWPHIPIAQFDSLFDTGERYSNNVAAMPSLHAAYSLLLVLFLWRLVPRWTRPLLALYPPAMAFALVYGGEHFVVDCIAGWIYAGATFVLVERAFARRAERAARFEPVLVD
ncbi:MAG TPA: phosphatase PAP2 family protein [Gaiellaceae bacterium]|nr:phosphatase PAP2 family protein [Gaiellaceae bacterium]